MHSEIDANKQYNTNIKDTTNWLQTTDSSLGYIGEAVGRVEELLVTAGNGAYGDSERQAIKDEINQIIGGVSELINGSFDGKYIFGGTRGTSKPVDAIMKDADGKPQNTKLIYSNSVNGEALDLSDVNDAIQYTQISDKTIVEVSQGVTMEYNVTASEIINYGEGENNLIALFKNITDHLDPDSGDTGKLTNEDLTGIKAAMTNLLKLRSEVGAKQNRMESAESRNVDANYNMTEILSRSEDIDITEKVMEYATMQNIYMASLQTSAKVIQPTLLDYI
jgi:flagellar hook-associated protein 3 FlgL